MLQKEKTLEEKIYLTWYEDGLIDIFTGVMLLAIGVQMIVGLSYLMAIVGFLGLVWVKQTKQTVTDVRLGKITFSAERLKAISKLKRILVAFMFSAIAVGIIVRFMHDGTGATPYPRALPIGIIMIVGMGLMARMIPLPRFSVYSLLLAGLMAVDVLLGYPLVYAFLVAGGIIVFMGTGDYSRFKDTYPIPQERDEEQDDE